MTRELPSECRILWPCSIEPWATTGFARERGARAVESYPMITEPGKEITGGEAHVEARQVFEEAGFEEVSLADLSAVAMRLAPPAASVVRTSDWPSKRTREGAG
jgi:hypothetical protein